MIYVRAYLAAEKRLSNEFVDTIGWAPATRLLACGAAAGAAATAVVSLTLGFNAGFAEACLVSPLVAFGIEASGRGGLASATFGLVGVAGWVVVAVVSADALPIPTLWAKLEKKPSDSLLC